MGSSRASSQRGAQRPRVLTRPEFTSERRAVEAIQLAEAVGLILDPWQRLLVNVTLAERADGKYAASEVAGLVARQNGKGGWLEAVTLHGMFIEQDPLTLWTAHQFKTSTEAFLRIRGWIDGSDDLRRYVSRINASHGEEGIELKLPGGRKVRLRFIARSKSSGRGFSPQRVIWDEAQELSKLSFEALKPAMRAQPNQQSVYAGTVPGEDVNNPEHFTRLRDRGRAGTGKRLAWAEWSPKGSDDPASAAELNLADPKHWRAANPGLGYRLTYETLADDLDAMDADSYAREALSIWPSTPERAPKLPGWADCALEDGSRPAVSAIGIGVSLDGATTSIGAAGVWDEDDTVNLGAVDRRPGTVWAVKEAKRIQRKTGCALLVAKDGPAAFLIPKLEDAGADVTAVDSGDYFDACASLADEIEEQLVTHMEDDDLEAAVAVVVKRDVGDGRFAWGRRKSDGDVSMFEAVTLARMGVEHAADPTAAYV